MSSELNNKVILITGASSGIGKALALQLAMPGNTLFLAARRIQELQPLQLECEKKGASCYCVFLDVSSPESIYNLAEEIKQKVSVLDILINNAGISQRAQAEETDISVDRRIMEVNFFGQVGLTKSVWPLLCNSTHANIVLISSVVGTFGFPQRSAYSASKHALEGFFESWMTENKRENIHFTTVSPGRIQTNISLSALKADGTPHELMDEGQKKGIPVEICATKIIKGIKNDRRKVYVIQNEWVLIIARKVCPPLYFWLVKSLKLS